MRPVLRSQKQANVHRRHMLQLRGGRKSRSSRRLSNHPPDRPRPPERGGVDQTIPRSRTHLAILWRVCKQFAQSVRNVRVDITSARTLHTEPHSAHMSDSSALLDTYQPFLSADTWEQMRDTVLDLVRPYALEHPAPATRQALAVLTGYLHWGREQGLLDRFSTPDAAGFIDLYLQERTTQIRPHGAAREAAILRELFQADKAPRRAVAPPRLPDAPYTDNEVAQIRAWACYAPNRHKQLNRTAIAGLALGCGLTASEMMVARTDDITLLNSSDINVTVRGARARTVPVLHTWAPLIADLRTSTVEADWLIAPGRRDRGGQTLNNVRLGLGGEIRPVPRRMRNTWLVTQVNGGTPPSVVMNAAGLRDADFLRSLAPYILMPTLDEQQSLLRNGGGDA